MGAVVVKKEEKVAKVFEALGDKISETDFIEKFKEMYPEDWQRINKVFKEKLNLVKLIQCLILIFI